MRLILLAVMLMPLAAISQKKANTVFGKVSKEELLLNTCEFDKDAEAMVLYESGKLNFDLSDNGFYNYLVHHVRIKIFNDKGIDYANVKLRFNSRLNAEGISNISAVTYNLDEAGNIVETKLDKKLIYKKKLNGDYSEQAFTLPEVKTGSIIEYRYNWRGFDKRSWNLQKAIPVKFSSYEVDFPSIFELSIRPSCTLPFNSTDASTHSRTIKQFSMENIPGLRDEKFITCDFDYMQRIDAWVVAITLEGRRHPILKTWPKLAEEMLDADDFGNQLGKSIPQTADLQETVKKIADPYQKMLAIHSYVRKNMTWNGVDNYWAKDGVKTAWKEKRGSSGEMNLILINLLRDAGIKVHPILVSTRENGRVITYYPDRSQFNKMLAFVELNNKSYVLDASDKYTPVGLIPHDVMYTEGMVLDRSNANKFRWEVLWDSARQEKNMVVFQAALEPSGDIKGHATVMSYDYARIKRAANIDDKEKFKRLYFDAGNLGLSVDSLKLRNELSDSLPLIQDVDFAGKLNTSGEYGFFTTNLFSGLGSNPFIADSRFSDVFYGANQKYTIVSSLRIPDGYSFEELPKNIRMTLPDKSLEVTRLISTSGNALSSRVVIEFKRPFYTPEEYADLKEFYKKMFSLLDEQVVIKKPNSQVKN